MNNDRELLELAAKAAGYIRIADTFDSEKGIQMINWAYWNPLNDFGDRYRLAQQLGLAIDFSECTVWKRLSDNALIQEYWGGDYGDEGYAIVRAAAEIGRTMR